MTTAHRPTWKAAVGREAEGGFAGPSSARSVLDENAHTKLKVRTGHQLLRPENQDALVKESLRKLEEAEAKRGFDRLKRREIVPAVEAESERRLAARLRIKDNENEDENEEKDGSVVRDVETTVRNKGYDDADDVREDDKDGDVGSEESDLDASDSDDDDSDDSDDSEDEEAALRNELAKIRAEREAAAAAEANKEDTKRNEEAALSGNPLLAAVDDESSSSAATGKLKRKWNDDVVFRNQARDEPDRNVRRFINDTVRNDFHKRFLDKFIK